MSSFIVVLLFLFASELLLLDVADVGSGHTLEDLLHKGVLFKGVRALVLGRDLELFAAGGVVVDRHVGNAVLALGELSSRGAIGRDLLNVRLNEFVEVFADELAEMWLEVVDEGKAEGTAPTPSTG